MKTSHTDHKHILITGGSGGIGIELIRVFAQASDHVTFTYRPGEDSRRRALDLVEQFRDYRVEALPWTSAIRRAMRSSCNR